MPSTNGHGFEPERVALYMRVSSEEQRQRQTIQTQQEFLSEYARVMELEVVDTYPDDGVLGTIPLEERSEGRRLLEDAKAGKFDTVLVYKPDRLDEHSSSSWRHTISLRRSAWRFGAPTRP
jgi:site-specific DNA recombinase